MQAIWQIPLCVLGVYCFCRGAEHWLLNRLHAGFAFLCGDYVERPESKRSWKRVLLEQMILLAVAALLWKRFR
jgi:hypothetical protein